MKTNFAKLAALICLIYSSNMQSQNKDRYFVWTFHDDSTNISGVSLGINASWKTQNIRANGLNLELTGYGFLLPLLPMDPIRDDSSFNAARLNLPKNILINGVNISPSGIVCEGKVNGLNLNGMGSYLIETNGISITLFGNFAEKSNGVQAAIYCNDAAYINGVQFAFLGNIAHLKSKGIQVSAMNHSYNHKGLQFGIINKSQRLKGIQIGLWNVNQKRKSPLINWNFKQEA